MKSVVLIGDSIRMGYEAIVRGELEDIATVWGPPENGGNSRNVLAHLEEWILQRKPDLVHINCGLHDLRRDFDAPASAVPLEEYEENVRQILRRIRSGTGMNLVWATTTPVNERRHHERKGFDRFEADVTAYNAAALRVAAELAVPVDDLYAVIEQGGRDELLTPDGVHYTDEGCLRLGKAVARFIRHRLKARAL